MSSENDVSLAKFFSTRLHTKLPDPCRLTSQPSWARPSMARRTVMRETAKSSASWRSDGSASSGTEQVLLDRLADRALQLLVQRQALIRVERLQQMGQ
jgi:hypothetical protein